MSELEDESSSICAAAPSLPKEEEEEEEDEEEESRASADHQHHVQASLQTPSSILGYEWQALLRAYEKAYEKVPYQELALLRALQVAPQSSATVTASHSLV